MEQRKREDAVVVLWGVILAYLIYVVVEVQMTPGSDYHGHLYTYLPMFSKETWVEGWKMVPYCMWHLCVLALNRLLHVPLEAAAAYSSIFFVLFAYLVMYWMLCRYTAAQGAQISQTRAAMLAFGLSVLQPLYFYWLDAGGRYLGTFSMNPFHNPTQICVRPFILLCFCLVCDIWGKQKDDSYQGIFFHVERGLRRYYVYLAVLLFLSAMAKPVFAEMFIPAVGLLMLAEWIRRIVQKEKSAGMYFRQCLIMLLCAVPCLVYILIQFLAYFIWGGSYGGGGGLIVTGWMQVWSLFSENVILSIALGMAFPLYILLIDSGFFVRNDMGRLAVTGYGIGVLEAALLGEGGEKLTHADFLWPMICGMLILWTTAMLHFLVLDKERMETKRQRIARGFAWVLFCLHVLYGLLYIKDTLGL